MNLKTYIKRLNSVDRTFSTFALRTLTKQVKLFIPEIKQLTPIDTGYLVANYMKTVPTANGNVYEIYAFNIVEYGSWVDIGHRLRNGNWWEGYHFTDKSKTIFAPKFHANVQKAFDEWLKKKLKGS